MQRKADLKCSAFLTTGDNVVSCHKFSTLTRDNSGHPVALPLVDVLRLFEAEGRVTRDDPTLLGRVGELPRMLDDTHPMLL